MSFSYKDSIVASKSFKFAINIIFIYKKLVEEKREYVLSRQLLRSATSIGANVREALRGESKKDFGHKMNIALKEDEETEYWIELLLESEYLSLNEAECILQQCKELCKMLHSIVRSVRFRE